MAHLAGKISSLTLVVLAACSGANATEGESADAIATRLGATSIPLPNAGPGIGFDDLRFGASIHRIMVPAGRTGELDLIDPVTRHVTSVASRSTRPVGS